MSMTVEVGVHQWPTRFLQIIMLVAGAFALVAVIATPSPRPQRRGSRVRSASVMTNADSFESAVHQAGSASSPFLRIGD